MWVQRFNALEARLETLKAGEPQAANLFTRARALFTHVQETLTFTELVSLDRALDRAGIHTSADAKLLRELGAVKGRLGSLKEGLVARAGSALGEYEIALATAEHWASLGQRQQAHLTLLMTHFCSLARIVKVATVFATASAPFEVYERDRRAMAPPHSAKLAVVEFLAQRAKRNVSNIEHKRRDLDLAHELLLRMGSMARGESDRLRRTRIEVGAARERVRSSPTVRSLEDLSRHLRHAARRDLRTAYRSFKALYERAIEANDAELAKVASEAVDQFLTTSKDVSKRVEQAELQRVLAPRMAAEQLPAGGQGGLHDSVGDLLTQLAFGLDDDRLKALELAAGASRLFDVEDALSENFVVAELKASRPVQRSVPYPTQTMTYGFATGLDEIHHFVLTQPGSIVLNLASGRQLVRQYLDDESPPQPKKLKQTAVRVYVLDASGSMHGARARFRDAILIAELNAIRVKGKLNLPFDPLYFSYFNDTPTELTRVDSAAEASRHIERLFASSPAEGQTDISLALTAAFGSIANARGQDPYLSRATVVLVTDGEDGVDLELIQKTQKPFEGLEIALSFISLGEENADLKSLVTNQRALGGRAFYQHLADAEIALVQTDFDSTWRTLLPPDVDATPDVLERLLPHLEALEAIAARRSVDGEASPPNQFDALFPLAPPATQASAALVTRVIELYAAIADTAALATADQRAGEAVRLLTHLLSVYGVSLPKYLEAAGSVDPALVAGRERIRLLCRPFD